MSMRKLRKAKPRVLASAEQVRLATSHVEAVELDIFRGAIAMAACLIAVFGVRLCWSLATPMPIPSVVTETRFVVDLNIAGTEELLCLPGIGSKLAQRIVRYRQQHGPFQTVDDLDRVHGIGERTLARLRPMLVVRDPALQIKSATDYAWRAESLR